MAEQGRTERPENVDDLRCKLMPSSSSSSSSSFFSICCRSTDDIVSLLHSAAGLQKSVWRKGIRMRRVVHSLCEDCACHWRRQLWGTGARAPPLDFQLVILGITRFTDSDENVQTQRDFCAIFINFWPIFVIFFAHSFPQKVILVPKMPERSPINFNSTRTSDSGKTGS